MLKLTELGRMVKSLSPRESFLLDRLLDESYNKMFGIDGLNKNFPNEIESLKSKGLIEDK
jgi:hypothetical protein